MPPLCPQFPTFLPSGAGFRRVRQAVGSETKAIVQVSHSDRNSEGGPVAPPSWEYVVAIGGSLCRKPHRISGRVLRECF